MSHLVGRQTVRRRQRNVPRADAVVKRPPDGGAALASARYNPERDDATAGAELESLALPGSRVVVPMMRVTGLKGHFAEEINRHLCSDLVREPCPRCRALVLGVESVGSRKVPPWSFERNWGSLAESKRVPPPPAWRHTVLSVGGA